MGRFEHRFFSLRFGVTACRAGRSEAADGTALGPLRQAPIRSLLPARSAAAASPAGRRFAKKAPKALQNSGQTDREDRRPNSRSTEFPEWYRYAYKAKAKICAACSLKPECTPNKRGRTVFRHFDEGYVDRVRAYRETEPYHRALRKRKARVEPLFAEAKDWHGMRRFRLRRLEKVNQEALMIAAGQNVKRLLEFGDRRPKRSAQAAALRPPERLSARLVRHHRLG